MERIFFIILVLLGLSCSGPEYKLVKGKTDKQEGVDALPVPGDNSEYPNLPSGKDAPLGKVDGARKAHVHIALPEDPATANPLIVDEGVFVWELPNAVSAVLSVYRVGTVNPLLVKKLDPVQTGSDVINVEDWEPGVYVAVVLVTYDDGSFVRLEFGFHRLPIINFSVPALVYKNESFFASIELPLGGEVVTIVSGSDALKRIEVADNAFESSLVLDQAGEFVLEATVLMNEVLSHAVKARVSVQSRPPVVTGDTVEFVMQVQESGQWVTKNDYVFGQQAKWSAVYPIGSTQQLSIADTAGNTLLAKQFSMTSASDELIDQAASLMPGRYVAKLESSASDGSHLVSEIDFSISPLVGLELVTVDPIQNRDITLSVSLPGGAERVDFWLNNQSRPFMTWGVKSPGDHPLVFSSSILGTNDIRAQASSDGVLSGAAQIQVQVRDECSTPFECAKLEITRKCDQGATATQLKANVRKTTGCKWRKNGNLSRANGWIRARTEIDLELDSDHYICDLNELTIVNALGGIEKIQYEDHILMTINEVVVLSSFDTGLDRLSGVHQMYFYDWSQLRGASGIDMSNGAPSTPYCLGTNCTFPQKSVKGEFGFAIDREKLIEIQALSKLYGRDKGMAVKIAVFGDNDVFDCRFGYSCGHFAKIRFRGSVAQP